MGLHYSSGNNEIFYGSLGLCLGTFVCCSCLSIDVVLCNDLSWGRKYVLIRECEDEPIYVCDGEAYWGVWVQVMVEEVVKYHARVYHYGVLYLW